MKLQVVTYNTNFNFFRALIYIHESGGYIRAGCDRGRENKFIEIGRSFDNMAIIDEEKFRLRLNDISTIFLYIVVFNSVATSYFEGRERVRCKKKSYQILLRFEMGTIG